MIALQPVKNHQIPLIHIVHEDDSSCDSKELKEKFQGEFGGGVP